jgi:hypothetical protein
MAATSLRLLAVAVAVAAPVAQPLHADEFEAPLRDLARTELQGWVSDPALVAAVRGQNAAHATIGPEQIDRLEEQWKAEIGAAARPLIDRLLDRPESVALRARQEASQGLVTEVFVMDNRGLNVAQSGVTSDYWQGDEDKWRDTYQMGPDAIHVGEVEYDDSTQTYQSQVSMTVVDPATRMPIGAVTFGVDVSLLP